MKATLCNKSDVCYACGKPAAIKVIDIDTKEGICLCRTHAYMLIGKVAGENAKDDTTRD